MNFDVVIIGFGVVGTETLYYLSKKLKKSNNKISKIAIIEKKTENIPGGVAYGIENSKYGFFNNPLRLSHPEFISWIGEKENIGKLIKFVKENPEFMLNNWLRKNYSNLLKNNKEVYFPRLVYAFFLKERISTSLKKLRGKKIKIDFFSGELDEIKIKENIYLNASRALKKIKISKDFKKINIERNFKIIKNIRSKYLVIGTGILPPEKLPYAGNKKKDNYIWDFYAEGGTSNLIKKIYKIKKNKKKIVLTFIGNKAGLLETVQQIEHLIFNKGIDIKINTISSDPLTLQKARPSINSKNFKFSIFKIKNLKKVKKASKILDMLIKEIKFSEAKGFNKYDVWTNILNKNLLNYCYRKLSQTEKKLYHSIIFPKIRSITRYTFPETIASKERLEKKQKIKFIKAKATYIKSDKKRIKVFTNKKKSIDSDIVINVSGPVPIKKANDELSFIQSLKKISNHFNDRGFSTDKNFMLKNFIFLPGTLSNNFNPLRQTIIKVVTNNAHKVAKNILENKI